MSCANRHPFQGLASVHKFFFFFEHRLLTPVGTTNLSMQVKIQPTYLTLGVDFCVYGPFYPTIRVTILNFGEL